jgi:Glycosyl hydrolases family 32 N-terminal domain
MRKPALLVSLILLVPHVAPALELVWSTDSTNVSASQPTRAVLVLRASPSEASLPGSWQLVWVADSSGVHAAPARSGAACNSDTAVVETFATATRADSAANRLTAQFCSAGSGIARAACLTLDIVAGSRGKLKAVALDPNDSSSVMESNEATFNGGIEGDFPAVVLRAKSVHASLQLQVTAIGSGLDGATSLGLAATDGSWSLPLQISGRTSTSVTGVAPVAALLPGCQASVGAAVGGISEAALAPDGDPSPEDPESCQAQFFETLLTPPPSGHGYTIQPKDFSFTHGFVDAASSRYALHLFYTRQNYWYSPAQADLDNKNLGHVWTTDFNSWYGPAGLNKSDTLEITAWSGKFDELHVWAPTIVQRGPEYWMFYTGVRNEGGKAHQRIGSATSTDLVNWVQNDDVAISTPQIPWAKKDPAGTPYFGAQQLRDPFVMADPSTPGQWIMYFVTVDSLQAPKMAVGAATSTDMVHWTALSTPYGGTEAPTLGGLPMWLSRRTYSRTMASGGCHIQST